MNPNQGIYYHFITVGSLVLFKLAVLVVGYLIARLGHNLLVKGISGEFKFSAGFKGGKADLVSASPGVFFTLMATVLITVGIVKDKPFDTKVTTETLESGAENHPAALETHSKTILPSHPVTKDQP